MPQSRARPARSIRRAPTFCATNAVMDWAKAEGISITKAQSFSATPTPAEGMVPMPLAMAMMTKNEMLTSKSWAATGTPMASTRRKIAPSQRMSRRVMVKGSFRRRMMARLRRTLTAWAKTVAMAAPATPMPQGPTRSRSPPMFSTQAMATVISGIRESPMPRKMPPSRL